MRGPIAMLRGIRHPEGYHGRGRRGAFFEGWYVKCVSADTSERWAIIPGISTQTEAFVQVLHATTGQSWYHSFPIAAFDAAEDHFSVRVGPNRFDEHGMHLELPSVQGDVTFISPLTPWPVRLRSPGAMGPYGLVPFMECYHGVVSMGHGLHGTLRANGHGIDFAGGRGYIEKDWGTSFPRGYLWMQTNHLSSDADASFVGSVAIIPWKRSSFRGFLIGLRHSGRLHVWATYNESVERSLYIDSSHVDWVIDGPEGRLSITAAPAAGAPLQAPQIAVMERRIEETMDARLVLRHECDGRTLFSGESTCTGLEIAGDIGALLGMRGRNG